uniref:Thymidine kinase, cytosolic n=1 Tax=Parascaris univalens TaxID=6257 RepID=A0A915A9Z3_PARUN
SGRLKYFPDFRWRLPTAFTMASGHIQLILGPMFSGKTTEMLRRLNRYKLANRTCRIVKYRNDTRYALDHVATHDLQMQEAISAVKVADVMDELSEAHVVAIDEGQFFDDIAECSENLANQGKIVIVSALDGDFNRKRFKNVLDMCPFSEDVIKLNAVCTGCGEDASFTKRLTSNTDLELIGGREMYTAMCRQCYFDGFMKSHSPSCGRIELILGPMFSGKTTEMLRRYNRHALAGRECRVIKYRGDTGHDVNKLVTHDRLMHDGVITTHIANVFDELLAYKVIAIDEGQFFPDITEYCERLANMGKIVIVAALDGDYSRKEFASKVLDLCPLAEKVCKLRAVCKECGNDASFSRRTTGQKNQEIIGGIETYRATCRACYADALRSENSQNHSARSPLRDFNMATVSNEGLTARKKIRTRLS